LTPLDFKATKRKQTLVALKSFERSLILIGYYCKCYAFFFESCVGRLVVQ